MRKAVLFLLGAFLIGCNYSRDIESLKLQVERAQSHVDILKTRVDSLESELWMFKVIEGTPEYYWLSVSEASGFIRADNVFYLSQIKTSFQENGVRVSGLIGNMEAMPKSNIELRAIVKTNSESSTGTGEVTYLAPGGKSNFNIFIATQAKDIKQVGFKIHTYRM